MKVFWSWQADTPGKIGRHFVRTALSEAIEALKADRDIIEPSERDARVALELDHDRQGVSGSPDLAATIFRKIDETSVFVADVTTVAATDAGKKLINSNVAIEYGHAHHSLGDTSILMVQNTHYGSRDDLPFDLRHKAGPIQYMLLPDASKAQIDAERAKLKGMLVGALRPFLKVKAAQRAPHQETPSTYIKAAFAQPHEVVARIGTGTVDEIGYRFDELKAFYLRLIPQYARTSPLPLADLGDLARNRAIDLLVRQRYSGYGDRNHLGAVVFEPHGTATTPRALTQAFPNGELWGLTTEMFAHWQGINLIPTTNVKNIFSRVLENFVSLSEQRFGNGFPVTIVFGAVGLAGYQLPLDQNQYQFSGTIHQNEFEVRVRLDDPTSDAQERAVETFLSQLYDLAGERRI